MLSSFSYYSQLFLLPLLIVALPLRKWLCVNSKSYSLRLCCFLVLKLLLCFFHRLVSTLEFYSLLGGRSHLDVGQSKRNLHYSLWKQCTREYTTPDVASSSFIFRSNSQADIHITDGTMTAVVIVQPVGFQRPAFTQLGTSDNNWVSPFLAQGKWFNEPM